MPLAFSFPEHYVNDAGILAMGGLPARRSFRWPYTFSLLFHLTLIVLLAASKPDPRKSEPRRPHIVVDIRRFRLGGSRTAKAPDPKKQEPILKSTAVLPPKKAAKLSASAKPVDAPYEFDPDLDDPHQLPLVLAARSASLGFGREDEPDTYRVMLEGPEWSAVKRFDEPRYVKDGFFEIKISGAAFLGKLRLQHPECDELTLVYGLFPVEFENVILEQMQESAGAHPDRKPTGFIVKFDSGVKEGVKVIMREAAKP